MVVIPVVFSALTTIAGAVTPAVAPAPIKPEAYGCRVIEGHPERGDGEALGMIIEELCDMSQSFSFDARHALLCCVVR